MEIVDLSKRFRQGGDRLTVLSDVSLRIAPQEFVSLLGPSGCGKSTLCNIVAGVIPADSGEILLDGIPLRGERGRVASM